MEYVPCRRRKTRVFVELMDILHECVEHCIPQLRHNLLRFHCSAFASLNLIFTHLRLSIFSIRDCIIIVASENQPLQRLALYQPQRLLPLKQIKPVDIARWRFLLTALANKSRALS